MQLQIALVIALASFALAQSGYSVSASIKNEFPGNLTFVGADLFLGCEQT